MAKEITLYLIPLSLARSAKSKKKTITSQRHPPSIPLYLSPLFYHSLFSSPATITTTITLLISLSSPSQPQNHHPLTSHRNLHNRNTPQPLPYTTVTTTVSHRNQESQVFGARGSHRSITFNREDLVHAHSRSSPSRVLAVKLDPFWFSFDLQMFIQWFSKKKKKTLNQISS
jgi:hypothetical protein